MNAEALVRKLQSFRSKNLGLLVDTNLLLFYFIGGFRRGLIRSFSRTSEFSEADFLLLAQIIYHFNQRITTTSHILTEVSNFLSRHREPERSALLKFVGDSIKAWNEERPAAKQLARFDYFPKFGLTDTGIVDVSKNSCLVLTNEWPLSGFLAKRNIAVLHFQELQTLCLAA
jgi:hypothetical protein